MAAPDHATLGQAALDQPATLAHRARGHHLKTAISQNWAGPILTGGTYDKVTTTFVVPQASCSSGQPETIASFWTGLDGFKSKTVEQAGVDIQCEFGVDSYQAWTEQYPRAAMPVDSTDFDVSPGDEVQVAIARQGDTDHYTLLDMTTGQMYHASATIPRGAQDNSAECIAEAPRGPRGIVPLTNFGSVSFSQCEAEVVAPVTASDCQLTSGSGCPGGSHVALDNIVGRKDHFLPVLDATAASDTGGAFTVTWHHG